MTPDPVLSHSQPPECERAEPAIVVRRTRTTDIDVHTEQLQDWSLHYDQLDCGSFEGSFTDIRWPGMQIFVETTTRRLRQRGDLLPDSFGIGRARDRRGRERPHLAGSSRPRRLPASHR